MTAAGFFGFAGFVHGWVEGRPGEVRVWDMSDQQLKTEIKTLTCALRARFAHEDKWLIVNTLDKLIFWEFSERLF